MIDAVDKLIDFGIQSGTISPNYDLIAHQQVRNTECPGKALFNVIKKFQHWSDIEPIYMPGYKPKSNKN